MHQQITPQHPERECIRLHSDRRPEQITCRECGTRHRAIVCPICNTATPSLAVIRGTRTVTIPACEQHDGYSSLTVTLPWVCLECGGPRGEPVDGISYDGSRRLHVHCWINPCGHVEKYSRVRQSLGVPA